MNRWITLSLAGALFFAVLPPDTRGQGTQPSGSSEEDVGTRGFSLPSPPRVPSLPQLPKGANPQQLVSVYKASGKSVGEIVSALKKTFNLNPDRIAGLLKHAGYDATAIAKGLMTSFNLSAKAMASALKSVGFSAAEVARALTEGLGIATVLVTEALQAAGFLVDQIAGVGLRPYEPIDDPDLTAAAIRVGEATAPPTVQQKLQALRQFVQQNNLGFSVGYTDMTDSPVPKVREGSDERNRTAAAMQKQNDEAARLIEQERIPSIEQILMERELKKQQGIVSGGQENLPIQIRPRGVGEQESSSQSTPEEGGEVQSRSVSTPCSQKPSFVYGAADLPPIRNQKSCGSCWAFAGAGIVDSSYRIRYGRPANVAEQELVDCAGGPAHPLIKACDGLFPEATMLHMQLIGVARESRYPYEARDRGKCGIPPYSYKVWMWGWAGIGYASVQQIKDALCAYGPVATAMESTDLFHSYGGEGVFAEKPRDRYGPIPLTNHVVIIVGWDDGKQAWRVRNSWGTNWGENGYAWVKYNHNAIGWDVVWAIAKQ